MHLRFSAGELKGGEEARQLAFDPCCPTRKPRSKRVAASPEGLQGLQPQRSGRPDCGGRQAGPDAVGPHLAGALCPRPGGSRTRLLPRRDAGIGQAPGDQRAGVRERSARHSAPMIWSCGPSNMTPHIASLEGQSFLRFACAHQEKLSQAPQRPKVARPRLPKARGGPARHQSRVINVPRNSGHLERMTPVTVFSLPASLQTKGLAKFFCCI